MYKRDVALIILYDEGKKVLIQFRDSKAKILPLYWGIFGGAIENGETPEQAVKREAFEELNYNLKNPKLILTQEFKETDHHGTKYVYAEKCIDKDVLRLQEGQDWGWFKLSEIKDLKMADHDKQLFEQIKDKIQGAK